MSSIGSDYSNNQKAMNEAAQEADEKRQRASRKAVQEARDSEQETKKRAIEMGRDYEVQISRMNKKSDKLLSNSLQSKDQRQRLELEEIAQKNRESRATETSQLRDQVRETTQYKKEAKAEYNRARAKAIEDVESEYSDQNHILNETHAAELSKLKASQKETERYLARSYDESIRDQNRKMGNIIRSQNDDHAREMNHSYTEYEKAQQDLKKQNLRDKQFSELRSEKQAERMNDQRAQAMQNQSKIYQKTISEQRQSQQAQIENLERKLNDKNTTDDPGQISAAAEAAVRNQMEIKYGKTFNAEAQRNARDRDQLTQNYSQNLTEARNTNRDQTSALIRDQNMERHRLTQTFVAHTQDVEDDKKHLLNQSEERLQNVQESMVRLNQKSNQEMRRHYEDLIHSRDSEQKMAASTLVQDQDFEKRKLQRDFALKISDLNRTHAKERTEERRRYEDQISELKAKLDLTQRESDKKIGQTITDLTRVHERRIAELESQNKRREHLQTQIHEDELEKVKRSHALMLSKKG